MRREPKHNTQYFAKEQYESGALSAFVKALMDQSYDAGGTKNEIRIRPEDLGAYSVDWIQIPWSGEYGGSLEFLDEDQVIMTEFRFPDGHTELLEDDESFQGRLAEWLESQEAAGVHWEKGLWGEYRRAPVGEGD